MNARAETLYGLAFYADLAGNTRLARQYRSMADDILDAELESTDADD